MRYLHELGYRATLAFCYGLSLLPFRILYGLSDVLYGLVYRLIGYRRKLVRANLASSFPEKTAAERQAIERAFYHWLCDYFLETIKLLSISREEMLQHIEFRNAEALEKCFDDGQPCAAILGHYCNWEYLSTTAIAMTRHTNAVMGLIYHPLRNHIFDRLFIRLRQHLGGTCIPKKDILRHLVTYRRANRMSLFGYIADQGPKWENIHLWLPFLNHETPVFTGAERIMRKMNNAVFYVDMQRPSRGKYICTFRLLTRTPNALPENEITRQFFHLLEASIQRAPQYYLWTHNRWKRTREEFDSRFTIEHGKVISRSNPKEHDNS